MGRLFHFCLFLFTLLLATNPTYVAADSQSEELFKYGSIGTDHFLATPYPIWKVMPELCADYLPQNGRNGYENFGLIYENGKDVPIGISKSSFVNQHFETVSINCASCHTAQVRTTPTAPPRTIFGMPANQFDVMAYGSFLLDCSLDKDRLSYSRIIEAWEKDGDVSLVSKARLLSYLPVLRKQAAAAKKRIATFLDHQPKAGPGRDDSSNPYKALFLGMDPIPDNEVVGNVDFMSIWNSKIRDKKIAYHWDGSIPQRMDRNILVAISTHGEEIFLLTQEHIKNNLGQIQKIEAWLGQLDSPQYPLPLSKLLLVRGKKVYQKHCLDCHGSRAARYGQSTEQEATRLGKVIPLDEIATDSNRLNAFSKELVSGITPFIETITHKKSSIRKTHGYIASYLDGIYLRGPYLHNGSVPTLWDLLQKPKNRPKTFYRGSQIMDLTRVGFLSRESELISAGEKTSTLFRYDTALRGNGNHGHTYGTELSLVDKYALIEYLKSF